MAFNIIIWNFQLWMIPLAFILLIVRNIAQFSMIEMWKNGEDETDDDTTHQVEEVISMLKIRYSNLPN